MKHKVGDTVRIKSREWWDAQPKNEYGYVNCGLCYFMNEMVQYCGRVTKIIKIEGKEYFINIDYQRWYWTDEMFEDDAMDAKTDALEAVRRAEEELAKAKKLLEQVEKDPRIGKLNKIWDDDDEPEIINCRLGIVTTVVNGDEYNIKTEIGSWRHARLLTEEEKAKYL